MQYLGLMWEIVINIIEGGLFLYLLIHRLNYDHSRRSSIIIGIVTRILWISFLNFTVADSTLCLILLLFFDVIYTYVLFEGSSAEKILWGCSYIVIALIADKVTFFLADRFTDYELQQLIIGGKIRVIMSLVYLLTCTMQVFALCHWRKKDLFLPLRFRVILLALICLGIIASDQLLNLIIYADMIDNSMFTTHLELISYIVLFIIFGFIVFIEYLGFVSRQNERLRNEAALFELKKEHYETISTTISTLRTWKHDYKTHLQVLLNLSRSKKYNDVETYITGLESELINTTHFVTTGNQILDALLSAKIMEFKKYNIDFSYEIYMVSNLPIDEMTFAALIGNLLNNAFDACRNLENNVKKYVKFNIRPFQDMLYISIENSTNNQYAYNTDGTLKSTKSSAGHGIGLKRIQNIVKSAHGFCNIYPDKHTFTVTIMLPVVDIDRSTKNGS